MKITGLSTMDSAVGFYPTNVGSIPAGQTKYGAYSVAATLGIVVPSSPVRTWLGTPSTIKSGLPNIESGVNPRRVPQNSC